MNKRTAISIALAVGITAAPLSAARAQTAYQAPYYYNPLFLPFLVAGAVLGTAALIVPCRSEWCAQIACHRQKPITHFTLARRHRPIRLSRSPSRRPTHPRPATSSRRSLTLPRVTDGKSRSRRPRFFRRKPRPDCAGAGL